MIRLNFILSLATIAFALPWSSAVEHHEAECEPCIFPFKRSCIPEHCQFRLWDPSTNTVTSELSNRRAEDLEEYSAKAMLDRLSLYSSTNLFVHSALQLSGYAGLPLTENGEWPWPAKRLYDEFEEEGWVEVTDQEVSRVGTVAAWPTMLGWVVEDDGEETKVVFPSASEGGELRVLDADAVQRVEPRYLAPPRGVVNPEF